MTVIEIKASGMIESYVLGLLSAEENRQVEGYFIQYPELKQELIEIQVALQAYAQAKGIVPDASLEGEILDLVESQGSKKSIEPILKSGSALEGSSKWLKLLSAVLILGLLGALYFAFDKDRSFESLQKDYLVLKNDCDSIADVNQKKADLFKSINSPDATIINLAPTPKYQDSKLLFYLNPVTKKNYIQAQKLPDIAANQAYQLWSLKANQDPIPLTVFKAGEDVLIPVDFEEGTGTYAITIENEAGALSPNLDNLIGTLPI